MNVPGVKCVGARASLGLNALQVAMGVRADLFEPMAGPQKNARGEDVGVCRVGGLGKRQGYERMVALAAPALREAIDGSEGLCGAGCPVVVALPARGRADDDDRFDTQFMVDVGDRCGLRLEPANIDVVRAGHAGGAEALRRAWDLLASGAEAVVVGGVDSLVHPDVLRVLDDELRLHAIGVDDGLIPGEAAAFLVLAAKRSAPNPLAHLLYAAAAHERAMQDESLPNLAEGITSLVRDANATAAPWVMNDVHAEHWRRREWKMVSLRHDLFGDTWSIPAHTGDVGAASGPLMAAIAATWWRHGCAPADKVVVLTSSEGAERGIAVLERAIAGEPRS